MYMVWGSACGAQFVVCKPRLISYNKIYSSGEEGMLQHSITHHVPSRCYNSGRGGMAVGTRGSAAAI